MIRSSSGSLSKSITALLILSACAGEKPQAEPSKPADAVAVAEIEGLFFMTPPVFDPMVSVGGMLRDLNRGAEERARAAGDTSYTGFLAVDSTGKVVAGTSALQNGAHYLLVTTDSAYETLVKRGRTTGAPTDSMAGTPDFAKDVVLVIWHEPPARTGGMMLVERAGSELQDSALVLKLNVAGVSVPAETRGTMVGYQVKVWRMARGAYNRVRIAMDESGPPVELAVPAVSAAH
jgi:hypothetical protein